MSQSFSVKSKRGGRLDFLALGMTFSLTLIIAYGTLSPAPAIPSLPGNDTWNHFQAFLLLILPSAALAPRRLVWTIPAVIAFGGAIELIQPFVGRDREFSDFIMDCAGILCGILIGLAARYGFRALRH